MTTKSPAETFGQQAEAVSGGKPMSWRETAARLAPLAGGMVAVGGVAAGRILENRRAQQEWRWMENQLADNPRIIQQERQQRAQREHQAYRRARQTRDLANARAVTNSDNIDKGLIARSATSAGRREGLRWTRPRFDRADL